MPHNNGLWGLTHRGFSMLDPKMHLASFLAERGYETVLCGIQHEANDASELGYVRMLGSQDYSMRDFKSDWRRFDTENAGRVADFIREKHDKPFFLAFGMFNTHRDFPVLPKTAADDYVMPPAPLADIPVNRHDMAEFVESARIVDECVGLVAGAIRESGVEDKTIVIFTTDHGPAFPEMKGTMYDFGIGVSLIIKIKGNVMSGGAADALVSHLDIYPTLCESLELEKPAWLQGVSLLPLLREGRDSVRDAIFAENSFHVTYDPKRCVRTDRHKYIRRYSQYPFAMPGNIDGCPDKDLRVGAGQYTRVMPRELLFDLLLDPCERVNLAGDPALAVVKSELSDRLDGWLEKSDDPIRNGRMIPPDGAKVQYSDTRSNFAKDYVDDWSKLESGRS
jgi:arylsulfatase A-like enzyme